MPIAPRTSSLGVHNRPPKTPEPSEGVPPAPVPIPLLPKSALELVSDDPLVGVMVGVKNATYVSPDRPDLLAVRMYMYIVVAYVYGLSLYLHVC